jgi:protein-export membrane protein SecD
MKKSKIRGLIITVVIIVSLYYFLPLVVDNLPSFWTSKRLKLGLDLQGGSQIQLEVDFSKLELSEKEKEDGVKTALEIIRNRIDQFGVSEPSIQRVGTTNRILVQLPGLKDPTRAKELIGKTALLEFKLLANAEQIGETYELLDKYLYENIDNYEYLQKFADMEIEEIIDVFETDEEEEILEEEEEIPKVFTNLTMSEDEFPMIIEFKNIALLKTLLKDENFKEQIPAGIQIAVGKENKNDIFAPRPLYFLHKRAEITGKYLDNANVRIGSGYDPKTSGKPYIALKFNKSGAKKFSVITGNNIKKRLAIVLDNVVYVAPVIEDKIPGGEAMITGSFTIEESNDLVIVLNAGNLPAPVNIIEERTVGPTLGSDSIKAGIIAAMIGMAVIVLFMIIYYGLSGFIADIAVLVNIGFIIAVMTMLEGTLTMPGIAGMILIIGMAVDANVIIFERIRENLRQGKTIRTAVDGGFSRALVTILDANITTLITALVLYQFGTGPIRGFAVTLSIGIIGSMFASIVLVKAIFDGFILNINRTKLSI